MTTTPNPYAYGITVREIDFGGHPHFEARVKEFPDVREYGVTPVEAFELAIDTIETAASMFAEEGRSFPFACAAGVEQPPRMWFDRTC